MEQIALLLGAFLLSCFLLDVPYDWALWTGYGMLAFTAYLFWRLFMGGDE